MSIALVILSVQRVPFQYRICARASFMVIYLPPYDWVTLVIAYMSAL